MSFRDLLKDKRILIFTASIVLFYGANAATLPLVGEIFGFIAKAVGFNASFGGLAAVAIMGGILYQWCMPETKLDDAQHK